MDRRKGYIYALIAVIGWGTNFIACKLAFDVLPPVTLLLMRYSICLVVLGAIYRRSPRPHIRREDRKWIIAIGAIGYFATIAIQMAATNMIDASLASLINTMTPVGIVFFAAFVLKEKTNTRQKIGIGVSLVGAMIIIGGAGENSSIGGIVLAFAGMLLWALASVVIRKTCQNYDAIWLTIYSTSIAVMFNIPAAGIEIAIKGINMDHFSWMTVIGVLWLGTICTAGSNLWWNQALERLPAAICSLFYSVMPFTTAILGIVLLDEKITLNFLAGAVLVITGMLYTIVGEMHDNKKDL